MEILSRIQSPDNLIRFYTFSAALCSSRREILYLPLGTVSGAAAAAAGAASNEAEDTGNEHRNLTWIHLDTCEELNQNPQKATANVFQIIVKSPEIPTNILFQRKETDFHYHPPPYSSHPVEVQTGTTTTTTSTDAVGCWQCNHISESAQGEGWRKER